VRDRCVAIAEPVVAFMNSATRKSIVLPAETANWLASFTVRNCGWVASAVDAVRPPFVEIGR
jgi:hypothetical protein